MWKLLNKEVDLGEPTSFLDHVYLGCTQRQCEISKDIVDTYRTMFESRISSHTNEESEVFDHDLDRFVTVQLFEETLAVLSLGKLCEDHGYSCEWVSGQKPRLTKDEHTVMCKTHNFAPLVVPSFIHQFLEQFVVNIDIAGFVFNKSSSRAK